MATTTTFQLPAELLIKIVNLSLKHKTPDYDGWNKTRLVNKLFKDTVEKYFVDHYLQYTSLAWNDVVPYDPRGTFITGHFRFVKLSEDGINAIFLSKGSSPPMYDDGQKLYDILERIIYGQTNYDTQLMIHMRRILSDIPPLNLKSDFSALESEGEARIHFDWRSTMTVIMCEERDIAAREESALRELDVEALKSRVLVGQTSMEDALKALFMSTSKSLDAARARIRNERVKRLLEHAFPDQPDTVELLLKDEGRVKRHEALVELMKVMKPVAELDEFSDESGEEGDDDEDEDDDDDDEDDDDDDDDDDEGAGDEDGTNEGSNSEWETDDDNNNNNF